MGNKVENTIYFKIHILETEISFHTKLILVTFWKKVWHLNKKNDIWYLLLLQQAHFLVSHFVKAHAKTPI